MRYLNRLRGMNPFPDAFDAGKSMAEICRSQVRSGAVRRGRIEMTNKPQYK
jgi:hypothetical protein